MLKRPQVPFTQSCDLLKFLEVFGMFVKNQVQDDRSITAGSLVLHLCAIYANVFLAHFKQVNADCSDWTDVSDDRPIICVCLCLLL